MVNKVQSLGGTSPEESSRAEANNRLMESQYDHSKYESDIYKMWESSGVFTPSVPTSHSRREPSTVNRKPFTIIMPPPNANDPLHIGHPRFVAIEDILIRY